MTRGRGRSPLRGLPPEARPALDRLYRQFDGRADIADPIHRVRRYHTSRDLEVAGYCAAALAFGRVSSVLRSVDALLGAMGRSPGRFVRRFDPWRDAETVGAITHRWARGTDLVALLWILRRMIETHGSIESCFLEGHDPNAEDVAGAIDRFSERALATDGLDDVYGARTGGHSVGALSPGDAAPRRGVGYFFPRPSKGSACKRFNLYLRWMVRRDRLDVGAWSGVRPAQLIVPLDVHVIRVGQCLGLTRYRSPGLPMAREITASLRRLDPDDPVKYDFALCHIGMLDRCGFREPRGSADCPLNGWCRPRRRRLQRFRSPSGRR